MGRDKARLRLGNRTMLGQIKKTAKKTGCSVRIIKRDIFPRCGPAGGVHAALSTTKSDAVLFLACDMPFVECDLLSFVLKRAESSQAPVFTKSGSRFGFPFVLSRQTLASVEKQLRIGACSIQDLAKALHAKTLRLPAKFEVQLLNVNTPHEWEVVRKLWRCKNQQRNYPLRNNREQPATAGPHDHCDHTGNS
jgi:molybdenum cofactor guanylyltransferase